VPEPPRPIRIVLADDHSVVREGVRRILETDPGLIVIGEASDGEQAVLLSARLKPDVVVLDVSMPRQSGLDALRSVVRQDGGRRALIFTASIDRAGMLNAIQLGARGVVLKTADGNVLPSAVRAIAAGDYWLEHERLTSFPDVMRRLTGPAANNGAPYGLTERQREIVSAVAEGLNNREIAQRFGISEHTVKHHLTQAFNKTGVSTRLELALLATQNGLVSP
jgi:two-component system, NarL family, nitrate/nitrite response regulator NarL